MTIKYNNSRYLTEDLSSELQIITQTIPENSSSLKAVLHSYIQKNDLENGDPFENYRGNASI